MLRPLRNLVLVERLPDLGRSKGADGFEVTAGGIICPMDYKARGSQKAVRKSDHFRARVIAVGPKVEDPLIAPGAEVIVLTWAEECDGTRRGMYTGVDYDKDRLFVNWPEDFGGVVLNAPHEETDAERVYRIIAEKAAGKEPEIHGPGEDGYGGSPLYAALKKDAAWSP